MTTFAELTAKVYDVTKRPELVSLTATAIRLATIRAHHTDFFPRDSNIQAIDFTVNPTLQFVDLTNIYSTLVQLRAIELLQCADVITGNPTESLEYREYSDLWDVDGVLRSSVFTLVGDTLKCVPKVATGKMLVKFYKNPIVLDATYSSWIADLYDDEVAMWAAAIIWSRTGNMEQAKLTLQSHVQPFKDLLIESHLLATVN